MKHRFLRLALKSLWCLLGIGALIILTSWILSFDVLERLAGPKPPAVQSDTPSQKTVELKIDPDAQESLHQNQAEARQLLDEVNRNLDDAESVSQTLEQIQSSPEYLRLQNQTDEAAQLRQDAKKTLQTDPLDTFRQSVTESLTNPNAPPSAAKSLVPNSDSLAEPPSNPSSPPSVESTENAVPQESQTP